MTSDHNQANPFLPAEGDIAAGARVAGTAITGEGHPLPNPATGEALATVGWVGPEVVDDAVVAASTAADDWSRTSPRERASALRAIAQSLRDNAGALAEIVSAESGKRLAEAQGEVGFSAQYFDWFAEAATAPRDEHFSNAQRRFVVQRQPVGVVAAVSPWNFPLSIPARKVAPALAAGCTVVQKPSELTPLSSLAFTELCEPHLPSGALGIIVGDGEKLTTALVDHADVAALTFTGSTRVGSTVGARAISSLTRVTLELGGRAPFIVCEDSDPAQALEALMIAKFRNNGASCLAANSIFVHRNLYDQFVDALRERVVALRTGDPASPSTDVGPMLRPQHVSRLQGLVESAKADGCHVSAGVAAPGWYIAPTLVEATSETALWSEEVFGPVCVVRRYDDEDAVVTEVNGWRTGLGGYITSDDAEHALQLASRLRIGIVGINNGAPNTPEVPFGGFGHAGIGREGGVSGMLEFTEEQTLSLAR